MDNPNESSTSNSSIETLFVTAGTYFVVFVLLIVGFAFIRKTDKSIYIPKTYIGEKCKLVQKPKEGMFSWIFSLFSITDEQITNTCGVEAYMFLYFLRSSIFLFIVFSIYGLAVLIPLNVIGQKDSSGLTLLTISNIKSTSRRFWAHLLGAYLLTIFFVGFVLRAVKLFVKLSHIEFRSPEYQNDIFRKSILIRHIPKSENQLSKMHLWFKEFSDGVSKIVINKNVENLEKTINKRDEYHRSLEDALTKYMVLCDKKSISANSKEFEELRPKIKTGFLSLLGNKVDSIDFYSEKLTLYETKVNQEKQANLSNCDSMVVIFKSVLGAHLASQSNICQDPSKLNEKSLNLHPKDVIWGNINFSDNHILFRSVVCKLLSACLIIFWVIPVSSVSFISNLGNLASYIPQLDNILQMNKGAVAFIQGVLPTILLAVLTALVPTILRLLSKLQGHIRESKMKTSVMTKYFWFLVVTVFLSITITSTLTNTLKFLKDLSNNPTQLFVIFSEQIPNSSNFFINYLLLRALTGSPKTILQPTSYVQRKIFSTIFTYSPRKKLDTLQTPSIEYELLWPEHTLAFTLGIVYCIVAPLLAVFITLYFVLYYFVYKYQIIYVYKANGYFAKSFFMTSLHYMFYGVYIFQIMFIGIMLKNPIEFSVLAFLLLLFTIGSHVYVFKKYSRISKYMPSESNKNNYFEEKSGLETENDLVSTPKIEFNEKEIEDMFSNPILVKPKPIVWLPKDENDLFDTLSRALKNKKFDIESNNTFSNEIKDHGSYIKENEVCLTIYKYPEISPVKSDTMY